MTLIAQDVNLWPNSWLTTTLTSCSSKMQLFTNCLLLFTCIQISQTLRFVASNEGRSHKEIQYLDQRYEGEYVCDPESSRPTTYGIGILEHAFSGLKPDQPIADPVMEIEMEVSADCAFWVPKGFNVQNTKTSLNGIQTIQTSSLLKTAQGNAEGFGVSVGVAFKGVSASAGYHENTVRNEFMTTQQKMQHFISWIESVDNTIQICSSDPPRLAPHFERALFLWDKTERSNFFWRLFERGTHYLKRVELGSKFQEIRSISESELQTITGQTTGDELTAEVGLTFKQASLKAGFNSGSSDSSEEKRREISKQSKTMISITGNDPDFESLTFDVAKNPGVVRSEMGPICDLFPENTTEYRSLKSDCYDYIWGKQYCYSQMPRLHSLHENDVTLLKEHFFAMLSVLECKDRPPPILAAKISSVIHFFNVDFRECLRRALKRRAAAITFLSGKRCQISDRDMQVVETERCVNDTCVTVLFDWPANGEIKLLKKAWVEGELLNHLEATYNMGRTTLDHELRSYVEDMVQMDGPSAPNPLSLESLNDRIVQSLQQTGQKQCNDVCKEDDECNFVQKAFQFHWPELGVNRYYKKDLQFRNRTKFHVTQHCFLFASVQSVTHVYDWAVESHSNFGLIYTSILSDMSRYVKTSETSHALTNATRTFGPNPVLLTNY